MDHQQTATSTPTKTDVPGIISIIFAFIGLQLPGFILGLIGAHAAKKEGRSPVLSRVGWILNLVFGLIFFFFIIIVMLAVPALQQNQRDTVRRNDLTRIASELENFYSNNMYYPPTLQELDGALYLTDPSGVPYDYTPSPNGCLECESYILEADPESAVRPQDYIIRSEDY